MIIPFHKYHALGNDFIVIQQQLAKIASTRRSQLTRQVCNRHSGVGADGVIFYDARRSRYSMQIFNADGGKAEISGNGLRILAHHIYTSADNRQRSFEIDSDSGPKQVRILKISESQALSQVNLDAPKFEIANVPMKSTGKYFINRIFKVKAGQLIGTAVNVGNPHIVFFVDNFDFDWRAFAREVESDRRFPRRTNVEFAVVKSRHTVEHRIWERGVGETSASGSGAASTVAAGIINGLLDNEVTVNEPAGMLTVRIDSLDEPISLTGPSNYICTGVFWFDHHAKNSR